MRSRMECGQERYERRFSSREQLHHYKLVVRADGSFAAKCLETDQYVAGFDMSDPELCVCDAAERVYNVRYGEFYTLFLRCTRKHLEEQIRKEYERVRRMLPKEENIMTADFPRGSVCKTA